MPEPKFIHLKCHSEYSLVDGMVRIKPLVAQLVQNQMPAIAITDQSNLFAAVKFFKAAMGAGIKPILGADLYLENTEDANKPYCFTALCQSNLGYKHLTKIISEAYLHGQHHGMAIVNHESLKNFSEGLIILSGAQHGDVGQALVNQQQDLLEQRLAFWQRYFSDRFYLEIQRIGKPDEENYNHMAVELASKAQLPLVATNNIRFLDPSDFEAHETRVCIHDSYVLEDPKRPRNYTPEQYLKSEAQMLELFPDLPSALENTVEIAKRCNASLKLGESFLPNFPIPEGMTVDEFLAQESREGLDARLQKHRPDLSADERKEYDDRLQVELDVICNMGFPGYFLIVADFIRWSKQNNIPVGPGRGSGAGSLVAYVLGITDLDPLVHELLFERFLNPERVSMPDFDVDFCMDGRDRVIDYVAEKYGRMSVSQIITFGTMAAKAVVRDVGRVMGFSYGHTDKIAKLIPFDLGMTLDKALEIEELLRLRYEQEEDTRQLIDMAKKLEGIARHAGKHAGGVVIAPTELMDFTAVYCEQGSSQIVSQFDKDDVEAVGLVKFDFLGLRTLTIIKWALDIVNPILTTQGKEPVDIDALEIDDSQTYDLLKSCQTHAVFQLESRGMRDLIKRLQPDNFEEIVALVALFRPGPLQSGMVDDFIDRKHGRAVVEYPHPDLEPILQPTYGVILYQEQVMQIAQVLAGYTLGGADILRRAMGKKKPEEMAEQRAIFVKGCLERDIKADLANYIFDLMEKFAGYGFNRSHSAAYALIAYQTAWLKTHYPAALMVAVLSSDMDNTDKVVASIAECKNLKLTLILPDINQCDYKFTLSKSGEVVYGLGAIKGVGQSAIQAMVNERNTNGAFESLFSLCDRVDLSKLNRRTFEALIKAGAFDCFKISRASLLASVNKAISLAEKAKKDKANKQQDLFGSLLGGGGASSIEVDYEPCADLTERERLIAEKSVLGWYASGHPILQYKAELKHIATAKISELEPQQGQTITVAGLVAQLRTMNTRRGDRMAFVALDDGEASIELAVFSDLYNEYRDLLIKDELLIVEGEVSVDEYSGGYKMSAKKIYDIESARESYARGILLQMQSDQVSIELLQQLQQILLPHKGGRCPVYIEYSSVTNKSKSKIKMGKEWKVVPKDELIEQLKMLFGDKTVRVGY